ncbi:hypothetical protein BDZ45DRAFT_746923 [Acephala macrosclerotiorum]|nr:hypothetical protein BDZ45DRAFT_746923 [Acephala macrosclerotiorum]
MDLTTRAISIMPCLHEISFYHDCGHTEHIAWTRPGEQPTGLETSFLPPEARIDVSHALEVVDGVLFDEEIEFHYRMQLCYHCGGSFEFSLAQKPEGHRRSNLHSILPSVICSRRTLWRELVDPLILVFHKELKNHDTALDLVKENQAAMSALMNGYKRTLALLDRNREKPASRQESIQPTPSENEQWYLTKMAKFLSNMMALKRQLEIRRNWFEGFFSRDLGDRQHRPEAKLEDRQHCLYPGWNSKFLARVDSANILDDPCSICYETLSRDDPRKLPCNHIFHLVCIGIWLEANNGCPMCRNKYNIAHPPYALRPYEQGHGLSVLEDWGFVHSKLKTNLENLSSSLEQLRLANENYRLNTRPLALGTVM